MYPKLAKFIRVNCCEPETREMLVKFLSKEVFGNTKEKQLNRLRISIDFYKVHNDIELSNDELLRQHYLFTYNILNGSPFNFSLAFFDFRCANLQSYNDLCVPMLQRQAGIIFLLSQTPDSLVQIYINTSHAGKYEKYELPPIIPNIVVPFLEELYGDDPTYDSLRLTLLKWSIDWEKLKDFYIEDIPENYMIDVLTLTFMVQKGVINSKEADIFLWVIKNVENKTVPKGLKPPVVLESRPFCLSFLYVKLFTNVPRSIEVCGLKKKYWVSAIFVMFLHKYNNIIILIY